MRALVKITGLSRLHDLLDSNELYAEPWTRMVGDVSSTIAGRIKSAAPTLSGAFASSIQWRVQKRPVPLWTKVTGNFPFKHRWPFMLDAGARKTKSGVSVYHFSRSGAPTRGWIKNTLTATKGLVDAGLERVAREIERHWQARGNSGTE